MKNRAVIWDMDGVLADTAEAHFRTWVTALAQWEIPLNREEFGQLFGMNNRDTLTAVLGRPPDSWELGSIGGRKEYLFRLEAQLSVNPIPGALRLLTDLKAADWAQALASSAPQANIDILLDKFGIRDRFEAILSGADLPAGKPDPALFLEAAAALGLPAERCVVVEDAPAGVEAARRAGMRCIAVATTRARESLVAADLVFDGLTQVSMAHFAELTGPAA
jgi:HAD superfamily hydrolase (TIGR01509 family)